MVLDLLDRKSVEDHENVGQKDEYPAGAGPCQKRGGLGMSTGIQPGRHEYQLSLLQW